MTDEREDPSKVTIRDAERRLALATGTWGLAYLAIGALGASGMLVAAPTAAPTLAEGVPPTAAAWVGISLGCAATLAAGDVYRRGVTTKIRWFLWLVCGGAVLAAFGLLQELLVIAFGQRPDSFVILAHKILAAVGAVLLALLARVGRARPVWVTSDAAAGSRSTASRSVQFVGLVGTLSFVPYVLMKMIWAVGGSFGGRSGEEILAISERNGASDLWLTLHRWGIDPTVLLAALGVVLLWGLNRPWGRTFPRWTLILSGRRVPRWLPLTPALIGAATLAPYGVLGLAYVSLAAAGVVTLPPGDFPTSEDAVGPASIGMVAFAGYGIALAAAAASYWRRTRASHDVTPVSIQQGGR